jgi:hypothetical protein
MAGVVSSFPEQQQQQANIQMFGRFRIIGK